MSCLCCSDAMPREDRDEGFGTAYTDMPYASSAVYRQRSQIRSRLPTSIEPPSLLMMEGRCEEKMWAPESSSLSVGRALLLAATLICLVTASPCSWAEDCS